MKYRYAAAFATRPDEGFLLGTVGPKTFRTESESPTVYTPEILKTPNPKLQTFSHQSKPETYKLMQGLLQPWQTRRYSLQL